MWSFGILVYEILTLAEPYPGKDLLEVALEVRSHQLKPTIPDSGPLILRELLASCCQFQSESRPEMAQIAELLMQDHQNTD